MFSFTLSLSLQDEDNVAGITAEFAEEATTTAESEQLMGLANSHSLSSQPMI